MLMLMQCSGSRSMLQLLLIYGHSGTDLVFLPLVLAVAARACALSGGRGRGGRGPVLSYGGRGAIGASFFLLSF